MTKYTLDALRDEVLGGLKKEYHLVYVDRGDELDKESVQGIVRGGDGALDVLYDRTGDWEADQLWNGSRDESDEVVDAVLRRWHQADPVGFDDDAMDALSGMWTTSDQRDEIEELIRERDNSDWLGQLARGYGDVLLRVLVLDEEQALNGDAEEEPLTAEVLEACGLRVTDANLALARGLIANCPSSVGMVYLLAGVDLEQVWDLPWDVERVAVINPHLLIGNPYSGAYHTEGPFEGTIVVARGDLATDEDAGGYSWDNCVGGATPGDYEAKIEALPTEAEIAAAITSIQNSTQEEAA